MTEKIFDILKDNGIYLAGSVSLSECTVTRPYKLKNSGFSESEELFAVILAVPYLTKQKERNISAYATPRDYHLYFKELFSKIMQALEDSFPQNRFAGFADDSPINEIDAAARAGLGIIGDNGMLITEKYSSYVFLGEIITDLPLECESGEIKRCEGCGRCKKACVAGEVGECLSSLTQKKGELSSMERSAIKKYRSAWGCDICQEVCPHTQRAIKNGTIYTDIEFFTTDTIGFLSSDDILKMSDGEFAQRAYSWRGRKTIERNLRILEEKD